MPEARPKVCVVTVCRNAVRDIVPTLQSVRAQRGVALECVVIDGASTDGTQERVAAFHDVVATFVSEPDKGIYDAMNKGWRLARGEAVLFLNAGDRLHDPDALAGLWDALEARGADVAYGDSVFFDDHQVRYHDATVWPGLHLHVKGFNHQSVLMRRDALERLGGFDLRFRTFADYHLLLRAWRQGPGRFAHWPHPVSFFRTGDTDYQARSAEKIAALQEVANPAQVAAAKGATWALGVAKRLRLWPDPARRRKQGGAGGAP